MIGQMRTMNTRIKKRCEPDKFLSEQFKIHTEIYSLPIKEQYMMLSSGVNHLPVPEILMEAMQKELAEGFLYQQYTALDGVQVVKNAVRLYENFLYSRGDMFLKADVNICMTIGASQAAEIAVSYFHSLGKKKMLLVGLTYPLYVSLGKAYGYQMDESRSTLPNCDMPTVEELIKDIERIEPDVVVFTYPCNPSGEQYTCEELDRIVQILRDKKIHCIFDCVCNVVFSEKEVFVPEPYILKYQMLENIAVVNSFSKTESLPGFRLGYLAGDYDLMQFAWVKQQGVMNPPNYPVVAVWIIMLFRCLYLSEQYGQDETERHRIVRSFRHIFFTSTVLCPQGMRNYVREFCDHRVLNEYERFKREMLAQEKLFAVNKEYVSQKLKPFLIGETRLDTGFNYLIKLLPCRYIGELDFCAELLRKTGIAVFTESGFALTEPEENDYWVRISLAAPKKLFQETIDRFYLFLEELESRSTCK